MSALRLIGVGTLLAAVTFLLAFVLTSRVDLGSVPRIDLEERVRKVAGPRRDSRYVDSTRVQRQVLAEGLALALDRKLNEARQRLDREDYAVHRVVDRIAGRAFLEIREDGDRNRGWGSVFVDLSMPTRLVIQIPHPVSDMHTESLGVQLFRRLPGSVLVLAGAHRNAGPGDAADVAHRTDSVFHAFTEVLNRNDVPAIQLHGFHNDSLGGVDVVVSTGVAAPNTQSREVIRLLRAKGLSVCIAWEMRCGALEGRTNVQGQAIAARGGSFLHIEISRKVRDSGKLRDQVIGVLAKAMRSGLG
jgi:hypothetical protein